MRRDGGQCGRELDTLMLVKSRDELHSKSERVAKIPVVTLRKLEQFWTKLVTRHQPNGLVLLQPTDIDCKMAARGQKLQQKKIGDVHFMFLRKGDARHLVTGINIFESNSG